MPEIRVEQLHIPLCGNFLKNKLVKVPSLDPIWRVNPLRPMYTIQQAPYNLTTRVQTRQRKYKALNIIAVYLIQISINNPLTRQNYHIG